MRPLDWSGGKIMEEFPVNSRDIKTLITRTAAFKETGSVDDLLKRHELDAYQRAWRTDNRAMSQLRMTELIYLLLCAIQQGYGPEELLKYIKLERRVAAAAAVIKYFVIQRTGRRTFFRALKILERGFLPDEILAAYASCEVPNLQADEPIFAARDGAVSEYLEIIGPSMMDPATLEWLRGEFRHIDEILPTRPA